MRMRRCIEIVAQRRRERQLVPRRHLNLIQHGRQPAIAGRLQELGESLHLGSELACGQPHLGCKLALGRGVRTCSLDCGFGCEGLLLDLGDVRHELLADLRGRL